MINCPEGLYLDEEFGEGRRNRNEKVGLSNRLGRLDYLLFPTVLKIGRLGGA